MTLTSAIYVVIKVMTDVKARGFEIMSELEIALWKRITTIVNSERRYFNYLDFIPKFTVDGRVYLISYGTFRNKVSTWVKAKKLETVEYSPQAFYTLKGVKFGNPMARDHTGALLSRNRNRLSNDPVYRVVQNLPLGRRALHDIRLRFPVEGIWSAFGSQFNCNVESKDISLPPWKIKDLDIKATVHWTDTVSIIIGCSYSPISVDADGIIRLSNALATVQERISNIVNSGRNRLSIPDHKSWIVTMWHFGADAITTYTREKFYVSWEVAQHALITAYSKDLKDGKSRVRIEKQEYPQKSLAEALEEKLDAIR
jgi:hypothetical protein